MIETHLRVICFHLMREGAWRPLWLVDVAAALEFRPGNFDWHYCLRDSRRARPVVHAIGLAHRLLGVKIEGIFSMDCGIAGPMRLKLRLL